mmetsp:Transcript_40117/g.78636  ORF Transcript_40117/g.78636 Transcript_40117/m.78636 type:complete len:296 (+) Transcript_40117:118-1005(+)
MWGTPQGFVQYPQAFYPGYSQQGNPQLQPARPASAAGRGKMGQQNTKQQRLDNAAKTGVFALQDKNLMSFPDNALQIPNLRTLHIENCGLRMLPSEVANHKDSLQRLKMPRNKLEHIPETLSRLQVLQQLDLSGNKLSSLPEIFMGMAKLKELSLARNMLGMLPGSIAALESLKVLDLSSNRLVTLPDGLGQLKNLEDLEINTNRLVRLMGDCKGLERLRRVNAENNKLDAVPVSLLRDTKVEIVKIANNPLKSLEGVEGYEEYNERYQKRRDKETDSRIGTGDLSAGMGALKVK